MRSPAWYRIHYGLKRHLLATGATRAPVIRCRSAAVVRNTWVGEPAAAHTGSSAIRSSSSSSSGGVRWPTGATPPIANPVTSRTQSASARASFTPSTAAAFAASTRLAPEVMTTTGRSAARNTIDLAICATVQPTAAAASAAVRVLAGNSMMVSGWPAAARAERTRSTEPTALFEGGIVTTFGAMEPLALYIHWPFCLAKCPYCDFNSHVRDSIPQARFGAALRTELAWEAARLGGRPLGSIFFGGGTPSLMQPATVAALIDDARRLFQPTHDIEITLEANPTSVEADRLAEFRAAGVNRVSLGVQCLDPAALRMLGRQHSVAQAIAALEIARRLFPRVSFDLIYARPGQTLAAWRAELRQALSLAADHLSLYQLTVEPGTVFEGLHRKGEIVLPDPETAAELYLATGEEAGRRGLLDYEVSNYAIPGAESRHNLAYWRYGDYAGIGPGAHGRITLDGALLATRRHRAPEPWAERVERHGHGTTHEEPVAAANRAREMLLMGLRLREGIEEERFARRTGMSLDDAVDADVLHRAIDAGYVEQSDGRLLATSDGRLRLDRLLVELVR